MYLHTSSGRSHQPSDRDLPGGLERSRPDLDRGGSTACRRHQSWCPIHLLGRFRPFPHEVDDADVRLTRSSDVEEFYREHADRLWRALYAYTGDPELASDAAASAIEQCLRRGESIRSPADWIWRAAFRIAR